MRQLTHFLFLKIGFTSIFLCFKLHKENQLLKQQIFKFWKIKKICCFSGRFFCFKLIIK